MNDWILEHIGLSKEEVSSMVVTVPAKKVKRGCKGKAVECYIDGFSQRYNSMMDAERNGFSQSAIWQAINVFRKNGMKLKHKGRYWRYA